MLDVNNFITLKRYLAERKIVRSASSVFIEPLPGGISNSVLRIISDSGLFVLKQAMPKLRVSTEWISDIERSNTEKNALKFLAGIIPGYVPELVYEDEDNYLFIMTCIPEPAVTWKSLLMKQECNEGIGRKVGQILGTIHQATHNSQEAKELFYDKKFFYQLRIEPFFEFLKIKHPGLKKDIDQHIAVCLNREDSLVIGDYSPKNILVHGEDVSVIDFEVAHYGDASFDLGFLTTHLLLKSLRAQENSNRHYNVFRQVIDSYFSRIHYTKRCDLELLAVRQLAWLLLARVDGKSPAEYVTEEREKQFIRFISNEILSSNMKTYREVIEFLKLKMN
ncbi:MAG: aminoglycoside phosphotransferase family protein [Ferruginibacter sp.]